MISKPLLNPIDISIGKLKVTDSHRNTSNTELNSLATIFDIKLSNKKCKKWAAGFLAHNGTYEEQKMIFQTTRSLTSAED